MSRICCAPTNYALPTKRYPGVIGANSDELFFFSYKKFA